MFPSVLPARFEDVLIKGARYFCRNSELIYKNNLLPITNSVIIPCVFFCRCLPDQIPKLFLSIRRFYRNVLNL